MTSLQVYNHIRKWRTRWSVISKIKSDRELVWNEDGCCFYLHDDDKLQEYVKVTS